MADDAFALSPISARASMPTEADYEAICGAFMETARGRWFLTEYAKRNRNADTRMVLDAVARIEATLASQEAAAGHSLVELLPAIAGSVLEAKQRILDGLPKTDMRPATEPIQRTAGVLRDVAWTLRESGADTRVCDLLDVQAKAIVDGCAKMHGDQAIAPDVSATVTAALDALERQIGVLAKIDAPPPAPRAHAPLQAEPPAETRRDEPAPAPVQPAASPVAMPDVIAPEALDVQPEAETAGIAEPPLTLEPAIAREAAPPQAPPPLTMLEVDVQANLWEDLEITEVDPDARLAEPAVAAEPTEAEVTSPAAEVNATEAAAPAIAELPAEPEPAPVVDETPGIALDVTAQAPAVVVDPERPQRPAPASLGQAALENGLVAPSPGRYAEALAPIRRMSQAEKVAFFS